MSLENLSDEQLEAMLLDATSAGTPGRMAMARVTAIRTLLTRRGRQRQAVDLEDDAERALEVVNAVRGPDEQLAELHPVDVASVLADLEWAPLVRSDDEMARMAAAHGARRPDRRTNNKPLRKR